MTESMWLSRFKIDHALKMVYNEYLGNEITKGNSWEETTQEFLIDKLQEEMGEVLASLKIDNNQNEIQAELLDVMCVAAMLYCKQEART